MQNIFPIKKNHILTWEVNVLSLDRVSELRACYPLEDTKSIKLYGFRSVILRLKLLILPKNFRISWTVSLKIFLSPLIISIDVFLVKYAFGENLFIMDSKII